MLRPLIILLPIQAKAIRLLEDLKPALEAVEDKRGLLHKLQPELQAYLRHWLLGGSDGEGKVSGLDPGTIEALLALFV